MYKAGSEFKDEMLKCGNGSPEWLDWITQHCCLRYFVHNVGCSSQQWFEGKMKPFSVVFCIVGPDMIENACFWSVSGVLKVCHFYWLQPCHGRFYTSWQIAELAFPWTTITDLKEILNSEDQQFQQNEQSTFIASHLT